MSDAPLVTVLLPVYKASAESLARSLGSMASQTLGRIEILLVANGSDEATIGLLRSAATREPRARVIVLPKANLAAALNQGLALARSEFVARMDVDDWSHPERLRIQHEYLAARPDLAACGCAWERVWGDRREQVSVPEDHRLLRWRLLLENPLAHGSIMLRRSMVQEVGGYDPACRRSQDYDLWLRLSAVHGIGAVPDCLYEYHARHGGGDEASIAEQGATAARSLLSAWTSLPKADDASRAVLADAIGPLVSGGHGFDAALAAVESEVLRKGSLESFLTRLWIHWRQTARSAATPELCRLARVREVVRSMAAGGMRTAWLWGAGRHTAWLIGAAGRVGLSIRGIVDDAAAGSVRHGFTVADASILATGDWVLISSDGFEEAIWQSSSAARARGVRVWRLYAENLGEETADRKDVQT